MAHVPIAEALWGLTDTAQFAIIRKTSVDHEVVETKADLEFFQGVLEPTPAKNLLIKPEGERKWNWYTLRTRQLLELDDEIQDVDGRRYRLTSKTDWGSLGDYYEYEATEGPK